MATGCGFIRGVAEPNGIDAFYAIGFVYYKMRYHSLILGWGYDAGEDDARSHSIKKAPLMKERSKRKVTKPYRTKF